MSKRWVEVTGEKLKQKERYKDIEPHAGWEFVNSEDIGMVYVELDVGYYYKRGEFFGTSVSIPRTPHFRLRFYCPRARDGSTLGFPDITDEVLNPDELEKILGNNFRDFHLLDRCPDFRSAYAKVEEAFSKETSETGN